MTTTPDGRSLRMFTIYDHPSDHPDHFVVRGCSITAGHVQLDTECLLADTLELARRLVPATSDVRFLPGPQDDPVIVETWM